VLRVDPVNLEHAGVCRTAFPGAPEACGRVLLVGELNPISSQPDDALYCEPAGCSGHRLQDFVLALPRLHYLAMWRTNLCRGEWRIGPARERAAELVRPESPWRTIVMLGRRVAGAFGEAKLAPFTAVGGPDRTATLVSIPHPSGLCRAWNDPLAARRARDLLAKLEPGVPWGAEGDGREAGA